MSRLLSVVILTLSTFATSCGTQQSSDQNVSGDKIRPKVQGYDSTGQKVVKNGLFEGGEACPTVISAFADRCKNAGFEVIITQGCDELCSGKIE